MTILFDRQNHMHLDHFTKDLSEFDEAEVTAALSKYLSERDGGRCVFDTEGYEREKHKSVC